MSGTEYYSHRLLASYGTQIRLRLSSGYTTTSISVKVNTIIGKDSAPGKDQDRTHSWNGECGLATLALPSEGNSRPAILPYVGSGLSIDFDMLTRMTGSGITDSAATARDGEQSKLLQCPSFQAP